ncbi:uncharacterized protein LOC114526919 [Dendronephthya gigantea]|uniref:uncharacterized protein LOC114526919 n=1 Tax=Dendronephthya gigantea TaxID=151771 RepID=UPI00106A39A6|nr:uncharacterized protein LOC114526919 [Dendronephthya gigantea]
MISWFVVLTLFLHDSLAYSVLDELDDYNLWRRNGPSVDNEVRTECKKDILILWDNSDSIGTDNFPKVVQFLENLITSPQLNVGEYGTHIGFITFSNEERTRELLSIGHITSQTGLTDWLESVNYNDLRGSQTFTGTAMKLALDEFSKRNPENYRADVEDVILLFTDGAPNPDYTGYRSQRLQKQNQKRIADETAEKLKNNSVLIVGLAAGQPDKVAKFKPFLENWATSPDLVFEAQLDKLDKVLNELVDASCMPITPAQICNCAGDISADMEFTKPGEDTVLFKWVEPNLKCNKPVEDLHKSVNPANVDPSGTEYGIGEHKINYTFSYIDSNEEKQSRSCLVNFDVAGACECPETKEITEHISRNGKAWVSWSEPKPDCPVTAGPDNPQSTSATLSVGKYTKTYAYTYTTALQSFKMYCNVNIVVSGKYCGKNGYDPAGEDCCCGAIHPKRADASYECCGSNYINSQEKMCCQDASVVSIDSHCPNDVVE